MAKDYYKILGISKSATDEDIKRAYRKLAHQYHPDKASGDESKFKEINEAYQVLGNQEKRSRYDRYGSAEGDDPSHGFSGGQNGFGFGFDPGNLEDLGNVGDIFEMFFEGMGGRKRKIYRRGADLEVIHDLSLEHAYKGLKSSLSINTFIVCEKCAGVGNFAKDGFDDCSACDGRGEVRETRNGFFGSFSQVRECAKCFGAGKIPKKICGVCSGAGRVKGGRKVEIAIAPGIADGQIIKIAGAGEAGARGAEAGDLYVRVRIKPHPVFVRVGDDLVVKKEVSLLDIFLGRPVILESISGKRLEVSVPENFSLKDKIKIDGEGMPRFGAMFGGRGDLYIDPEVKTPKKLSVSVRKKLEDLRGEDF